MHGEGSSLGLEGNVVSHKDALGQVEGRRIWELGRESNVVADLVLHSSALTCQVGHAAA